jgi:hypothetical protein
MKKPREAADAYRTILRNSPDQHYYWFRARERLGRLSKKGMPSLPAADVGNRKASESHTLRARKARALRALGFDEEAVEEYSDQIRTHPEDRGGLGEACRAFLDLERYDKAVWLAGQILRPLFVQESGQPPIRDFWQCLYPRAYWSIVREEAMRQGLDAFLVTALIREESAFAQRVVSRAGARGLMQLMPQTAEQVAREHKLVLGTAPLESPEANIRLGTIHLADLIRDNGGNVSLALAGYNAGQQQVRRWRDRFGFTDEEEFTEDIPYTETRNYVKRVLGSFQRYASLYGARRAASREPRAERRCRTHEPGRSGRLSATQGVPESRLSSLDRGAAPGAADHGPGPRAVRVPEIRRARGRRRGRGRPAGGQRPGGKSSGGRGAGDHGPRPPAPIPGRRRGGRDGRRGAGGPRRATRSVV